MRIRSLAATPDVKMSKALQVKAGKTDSSKGSVNAYVLFSTAESADAAKALNMTKFSGQHIRVDRAVPPKEEKSAGNVQYDSRRSVFVGNLPRTVTVSFRALRYVQISALVVVSRDSFVHGSNDRCLFAGRRLDQRVQLRGSVSGSGRGC